MGSIISRVGFVVNKVKIRVYIVLILILAKLFLKRQLICPKVNFPLVTILLYSKVSSTYQYQ